MKIQKNLLPVARLRTLGIGQTKSMRSICLALAGLVLSSTASAFPLQVTTQGQLTKDIYSSSFFGITDPSAIIQISFNVETDMATVHPAGTPVIVSSGAAFNSDAFLFTRSAISNLIATIGNVTFSIDDFINMQVGTSSSNYDFMLTGDLLAPSLIQFNFNSSAGLLVLGNVICTTNSCGILDVGFGESYLEGASAEISGIQVFTQNLAPTASVPEPGSLALLAAGMLGLVFTRRFNRK